MVFDVIVVGGGISGLSAAKWLKDSGLSVVLLEARDRVGGRTLTKHDPKVGGYVDLGGAYLGVTQNRLLRMAKELGVENYKINEVENLLYYSNGRRIRFPAKGNPVQWNPFVNMDTNNIFYLIDKMGEQIPNDAPWDAPKADEWDTMTFREFLDKNCWTKGGREFFDNFLAVIITTESYEASLLSALWYIKQCGGTRRIIATTNGGQERKFKGGSQQISEKIAERLGDSVIKNSPVVEINQESTDVVVLKTLGGDVYEAKYVILATPPMLQMKIHFRPSMPPLRNQLMQRMPMGTVMKVHIYYSKAFWREKGLCGSFFIEGGLEHPLCITLDDTKPDGSYPAIMGFIAGDKLRRLVSVSVEERKRLIAQSLAEATGLKEFLSMVHYEEKNWMEEQYSGGCYTAMYPPGFFTRYGRHLRTPVDRVHFAGTETAVEWSGYMEGGIEAGERAAREILHRMGRLDKDQIFQQEPPSQEVIAKPFETTLAEKLTPSVPGFLKIVSATSTAVLAVALYKSQGHIKHLLRECVSE